MQKSVTSARSIARLRADECHVPESSDRERLPSLWRIH